ncbi:MAG TPA: dihydrofolate reductase family protein [Pirellulales bacterium]
MVFIEDAGEHFIQTNIELVMRLLKYLVAMSLDGFLAGPNGEYDWIVMDPAIDFTAIYKDFDIALMGRRTYELACQGPGAILPGMQTVVCSRTLVPDEHPKVIVTAAAVSTVLELKQKPGKNIWLFGGGILFRNLLDAGLVDTVEVSLMPILLSEGVPLLPAGRRSPQLRLVSNKIMPGGSVALTYQVEQTSG